MRKALIGLLVCLFMSVSGVKAGIIANSTTDMNTLTKQEAFQIFNFELKFYSGQKLRIVLPPENSLSFSSLATQLGRGTQSYLDVVKSKEHGGVASPIWASSESNVITKVAVTPYSVGFFHDTIAINTGIGVRIISVAK